MPETRSVRVGLHARNDTTFADGDYLLIQQARIETLKILSSTATSVFQRLRQGNPNLEFIVRLCDPRITTSHPTAQEFAAAAIPRINELRPFAVKFEIHNEPNHNERYEGWGSTDDDARSFRAWYLEVLRLLRPACPWARFGFPGLAPNGPHRDLEWLELCRDAIRASDWLGCHGYWQFDNVLRDDWGLRFKAYHDRFPDKVIEITEFGDSTPNLSGDVMAANYVVYLRELFKYRYLGSASAFIASSSDSQWATFVWRKEGGEIRPMAAAVGNLARPPLAPPVAEAPKPTYSVEWLDYRPPAQLMAGQRATVRLRLRNAGTVTWQAGQVSLGYRWYTPQGQPVTSVESLRTALPANVAPGMTLTLTLAALAMPLLPGSFVLKWDLVEGDTGWFSVRGAPTYNVTAKVEARSTPDGQFFPQTGCTVSGSFLTAFNHYGQDVLGPPVTDAFAAAGINTQYFQNAVLYEPTPGQVQLRNAGSEVLAARQRVGQLEPQAQTLSAQIVTLRARLAELSAGLVPRPPIQDVVDSLLKHPTKTYETRTLDKITTVVVHHTAAPGTVGPVQIARYQVNSNDWPGIGYHFVIMADGTIYQTNHLETISFHAREANPYSVAVCFAGHFVPGGPTDVQLQSGGQLLAYLLPTLKLGPEVVKGHKDFVATTCPGTEWDTGLNWRAKLLENIK